MLKVKIIENTDETQLENEINNFIKNKNINNIQYSPIQRDNDFENITNHYAMIIYESEENEMNVKIGVTERGDAGLDLSWYEKIKDKQVDGAILITKNITDDFLARVWSLHNYGYKIIIHCTCTGWGGTIMEPNAPTYQKQLKQLSDLITAGFPVKRCVLRIDPIFPTTSGMQKVADVLEYAYNLNLLPEMRVRISIFDEYKHVKERFKRAGFNPMYGNSFYAPQEMMEYAKKFLEECAAKYKILFETCAEPALFNEDVFVHCGCVSEYDLELLNLPISMNMITNMQHRNGCMCLSCKTELLNNKKQCPHKCLYCYWKPEN